MTEAAVGLRREAGEIMIRDGAADERTDDFDCDFRIGPAGKACDRRRIERRPSRRNIEPAIAGKP